MSNIAFYLEGKYTDALSEEESESLPLGFLLLKKFARIDCFIKTNGEDDYVGDNSYIAMKY